MHNIRPAGQMWPTEAFSLDHEAQTFVQLACFFHKSIILMCKNSLKNFGPAMGFKLCSPDIHIASEDSAMFLTKSISAFFPES